MYDDTISKSADNEQFKTACKKIEDRMHGLKKEKRLVDVDGSLIQIYYSGSKKIKVYNDYEVDAVYVESDMDLSRIF